jgi:hypothetical protein
MQYMLPAVKVSGSNGLHLEIGGIISRLDSLYDGTEPV